nr:hypothetical protein Itr_chr05CG01750 [Ipomoea trifida]
MAKISEAYCLLLSNSFTLSLPNNHFIILVLSHTSSETEGFTSMKFSMVAKVLYIAADSSGSASDNLLRLVIVLENILVCEVLKKRNNIDSYIGVVMIEQAGNGGNGAKPGGNILLEAALEGEHKLFYRLQVKSFDGVLL